MGRACAARGTTSEMTPRRQKVGRIDDLFWQEPARPAPRRRDSRRRYLIFLGVFALGVAAVVYLVQVQLGSRPRGGDPHGKILKALGAKATESIPPSASVIRRNDLPPVWDSCDGRKGTFGWDPVRVVMTL